MGTRTMRRVRWLSPNASSESEMDAHLGVHVEILPSRLTVVVPRGTRLFDVLRDQGLVAGSCNGLGWVGVDGAEFAGSHLPLRRRKQSLPAWHATRSRMAGGSAVSRC